MNMLFVLILMSLVFLAGCVYVFFWAIKSKQFKELDIQGFSILEKDEYQSDESITKNTPD